jgi:hypothetical protein
MNVMDRTTLYNYYLQVLMTLSGIYAKQELRKQAKSCQYRPSRQSSIWLTYLRRTYSNAAMCVIAALGIRKVVIRQLAAC